ncbi:type VI secretion system Vgr family protein [Paraburkholderia sp. ZP32-5]|uniref:type VI secretion system Vgr family protein n=1 Tax=Paraburkholderia sp. ZP32-5 TaxID=2883245 RepID=UPI001F2AFE8E|nr:type VI secretion system Vgr family protein [Paraburkholderia sp. ZP32-5]
MNLSDLSQAISGGVIQSNRLLKADIPVLPDNTLLPQRAVTYAELGRDFNVAIDLASSTSDLELKKLMSQSMTLWIQQADGSYLPLNGYIQSARCLGTDGETTSYQVTFTSWLHYLRLRRDMRIWQDKAVDAVLTDLFNEHPQAKGRFEFALTKTLPSRSYIRQSETDWNFAHRLMEEEGLFGFWRHASDGKSHTFVITDNLQSVDSIAPVRYYRSDVSASGTDVDALSLWAGSRTLQSAAYATRTFDYKNPSLPTNPKGTLVKARPDQGDLPSQAEVYEYTGAYTFPKSERGDHLSTIRIEEWESRAKRFFGIGGVRAIDAGRAFELTGHPEHDRDAEEQRKFVAIKVWRYIENNLPVSDHAPIYPYSLKKQLQQAQAERSDDDSLNVPHADGSTGFYLVEIEAQRTTVPYRSPFEHTKPVVHLETAIVVGPKGEEVYTDELNRIKIFFMWDRQNPGDESASCWVRTAQSDTGAGYGGVHVPRVGEEVLIGYVGGDCDRPIVLHRLYNGKVQPAWHSHGIFSGFKSKEYNGSNYSQFVLDDATGQTRTQLLNSGADGVSLLHLGYLIDQGGNSRGGYLGSGFDLKTDSWGAVRANLGMYVSTHAKPASSQPLDAQEAQQQMVNSESLLSTLSDASEQLQAESLKPGHDALKDFADATQHSVAGSTAAGLTAGGGTGNANAFQKPIMLLASPAGIGLSSKDSIHAGADRHINVASGMSTFLAAGKSLVAGAVEKISLFAQNAGVKVFAGKGPVQIQAQDDNIEAIAQQVIKLLAIKGNIEIAAQEGIKLSSGGATIEIKGGDINVHAPGKLDFKGTQHSFAGPVSEPYPLQPFKPPYQAQYVLKSTADGAPLVQHPYQMQLPSGRTLAGHTNDLGETMPVYTPSAQGVNLKALQQDKVDTQPWQFAGGGQPDIWADYKTDVNEGSA